MFDFASLSFDTFLSYGFKTSAFLIGLAALIFVHELGHFLIARKCGPDVAYESAARAAQVLDAGTPQSEAFHDALGSFDFWLRSDHHHRNPGTTADLIAAGLFVGLREGSLVPPFKN